MVDSIAFIKIIIIINKGNIVCKSYFINLILKYKI